MSANEIAERIAACAWIRIGPSAADAEPDETKVSFRSLCGFENKLYIPPAINQVPVLAFRVDRELSRRETTVLCFSPNTQDDARRISYPMNGAGVALPVLAYAEPFHESWLGAGGLDAPPYDWFPWGGIVLAADPAVPAGFDLDRYNCVSVYIPPLPDAVEPIRMARDVCVLIVEHPIVEGGPTQVIQNLPIPG